MNAYELGEREVDMLGETGGKPWHTAQHESVLQVMTCHYERMINGLVFQGKADI